VAYGRATPIAHALDRALAGHAEAAPAV
jgi:hypothetical protein